MTKAEALHYENLAAEITPEFNLAVEENNLCKVLNLAKPFLVFMSNFWFLPAKWKGILKGLVTVSEKICPTPDIVLIEKKPDEVTA